MGSDSSKEAEKALKIAEENLRYGLTDRNPRQGGYQTPSANPPAQRPHTATVSRDPAAPPPYSSLNPTNTVNHSSVGVKSEPPKSAHVPTKTTNLNYHCQRCFGFHQMGSICKDLQVKMQPPIPPLPKNNQYKWTRDQSPAHPPNSSISPNNTVNQSSVGVKSEPLNSAHVPPKTRKPDTLCQRCFNFHQMGSICKDLQDKMQPPIPPLQNNNQYKWIRDQSPAQPIEFNTSQNSVQQNKKLTPSPTYDSIKNPYVWVNNQKAKKNVKVFDIDQELPKIHENKLPNFQLMNKQLNKNKPLSDVRKHLVNNKYLSDVTFIIGGSTVFGHKMFLITSSFLFYDHFHVKGEKTMMVDSIDFETFEKILTYCYTDEIKVTEENVLELLQASSELEVRQITNICHGFISNLMNQESVFIIFEKALELENEIFQKKCLDYINKNEDKCFSSRGFFAISLQSLLKILGVCDYPQEKVELIINKYTAGSMETTLTDEPKPDEVMKPAVKQESAKEPPKKQTQNNPKTTQPQKQAQQNPKPAQQASATKGAVKKTPKKKPEQKDPDLMSAPFPSQHAGSPMMPHFPYPPQMHRPPFQGQHLPPFHNMGFQGQNMGQFENWINGMCSTAPGVPQGRTFYGSNRSLKNMDSPLINFDDDDKNSIISKDDDLEAKKKVDVLGSRHQFNTEFSRLDFVCKRSMLLHTIWFSEDLAKSCKSVSFTISVFENNKRSDIHQRTVKFKQGMKMKYLTFARDPLKIYIGQKFFVKLNFSEAASRLNVNADAMSSNNMLELRKDADIKKYFNCITSVVVTEMP